MLGLCDPSVSLTSGLMFLRAVLKRLNQGFLLGLCHGTDHAERPAMGLVIPVRGWWLLKARDSWPGTPESLASY